VSLTEIFILTLLVGALGYLGQTLLFIIGAARSYNKIAESDLPTATVLVAAKNEQENIGRCLKALDELEYPEGKLQIVLVDDKSTDNTSKIIDEFIKNKPKFVKIISTKEIGELKGKTNALANGTRIATGEVILTTDADCAPEKTWVKTICSYYEPGVGVVNGFTSQEYNDRFTGMQNLDFIYLLSVAAGTINTGMPISCIGNNMSYLKKAYEEVGGYESLPFSITEDFNLMMAIIRLKKYKIRMPLDRESLVVSSPCLDYKTLYRQKKRWGIGGLKAPLRGWLLMVPAYVINVAILLSPVLVFLHPITLIAWPIKMISDFVLLMFNLSGLGIASSLKHFMSYFVYSTLYVVLLPFVVISNPTVVWKERKF